MNFIVDFKNSASEQQIAEYLTGINATVNKTFNAFDKTFLISTEVVPTQTDIIEHIIDDDNHTINLLSTTIVPDNTYGLITENSDVVTISTTDQKDWWKNYVLTEPEFDAATTQVARRGKDSTIYIMDSGIMTTHPDFANTNITNFFSFTGDFTDTAGHGTALASLMVGNNCGLGNAKIKSVKIFDKNVATKQSDMLTALDAIIGDVQSSGTQLAVVNCSWAIPKNTFVEQKLRQLIYSGVFVVASAGNSGVPIGDVTPAGMEEVITIGSFNQQLTPSDFSDYTDGALSTTTDATNHGELDGWAPGENVYVATLDGGYGYAAGTSLSAAIHSMVIAYDFELTLDAGEMTALTQYIIASASHNWVRNNSLKRSGLIDLSDPKYAQSVNLVSTLMNKLVHLDDPTKVITKPVWSTQVKAGEAFAGLVFNPRELSAIVKVEPWDSCMEVTTIGLVTGVAPMITEPYKIIKNKLDVTYLDGTTMTIQLSALVQGPAYDPDVPVTDPDLEIELQVYACSSGTRCYTTSYCSENCAAQGYTFCDTGTGAPCASKSVNWCVCV